MRALDLTEKKLRSELKYSGVIVDVTLDEAELCSGSVAKREVVHHPGGVAVLPLDADGSCYMVRQYRYPVGDVVLEIPAGKLDRGEEHMVCAVRELSEETGLRAQEYVDLGCFYTSPGYSDEIIHVNLAMGLQKGESHPDEDEFLRVEKISLERLTELAMDGSIIDAKTVIAVLKARRYLDGK